MRKPIVSLAVTLALVGFGAAAFSQSKGLGLSAAFCSAALDAVRAVDSFEGYSLASGAEANSAVNSAGAEAHSRGEQDATKALHGYFEDKLDNNVLRAHLIAKAVNAWKNAHADASHEQLEDVRVLALDQPGVREMTKREDDCATDMSRMLRSGTFRPTHLCDDVRLSHDEHAMAQYFK